MNNQSMCRRRVACAFATLVVGASAQAQAFLQDLGAGSAVALGNNGTVLYASSINSNGTITALPAGFVATAINASGMVAGQDAAGHAAIYNNGTVTDLGVLPGQGVTDATYATAINAAGDVLGYAPTGSGGQQGFIYSGGVMTSFNSLPGMPAGSRGSGLNDLGVIVGTTGTPEHIFTYDHGTFTDLGAGEGAAINSAGQLTGYLPAPPNHTHTQAFLYSKGQFTILTDGAGNSINAVGQVLGNVYSNEAFASEPWLYSGTVIGLNSLIVSTDPLQPYVALDESIAISDTGLILATGTDSRVTGEHSYLLQAPPLTVSPGTLTFAGSIGVASAPQTETLTNLGSAPLVLTSISAAGNFAQTNNCPTTLAAGAHCSVSVIYTATASGDEVSNLTVNTLAGPTLYGLFSSTPIAVSLTASAAQVTVGTPVTLSWSISPGASCNKSGGSSANSWSGGAAASGTQSVGEAAADVAHYALICSAGSQSATFQVAVIYVWPASKVTLSASPTTITAGQSTTLTWTSTNTKSCTPSGGGTSDGWTGSSRGTSGSAAITEPVTVASALTLTYTLTCINANTNQSTAASAKVVLNPAAPSHGGGGALDTGSLAALGALWLLSSRKRPRALRSNAE